MDDQAVFMGRTIGMKTMASGATRLTIEFDSEVKAEQDGIWTSFAAIGSSVAVALMTPESGQAEQRRRTIEANPARPTYGHVAKALRRSSILTNHEVVKHLGSDAEYQEWCRKQNCVVTNEYDWNPETGEGRCEYAHVRRAGEAGTGYKPEYSGVPLCAVIHRLQHQQGELAVLRHCPPSIPVKDEAAAHAWFNAQALKTLHKWAWERLKENIGADSMRHVSARRLYGWFSSLGIGHLCPLEIRKEADRERD